MPNPFVSSHHLAFGTGSDHIREKDGIWAVLAWLNIISALNLSSPGTGIADVLNKHYQEFGRNYFSRYDYEGVSSEAGAKVIQTLRDLVVTPDIIQGKVFNSSSTGESYTVAKCDDFLFVDSVDQSVSKNQGIRFIFTDGSRIVFRGKYLSLPPPKKRP